MLLWCHSNRKMLCSWLPALMCIQACCQYMLQWLTHEYKICTVTTAVLARPAEFWAHMLMITAWWTPSLHVAMHVWRATLHACAESQSLLTVQSLYLPDTTTSSVSAVSGSSAADFTSECLRNVIRLDCAASEWLIRWTGSPTGLMLWLSEFVFCAKISRAKKYFCSKGTPCAFKHFTQHQCWCAQCHGKAYSIVWQDHCCSMEIHVGCSRSAM